MTERTCATCRWRRRDKFAARWERSHSQIICDHPQGRQLPGRDDCCLLWEGEGEESVTHE